MKLITATTALLSFSGYASAALCIAGGLLGIGALETLPETFVLKARNANGSELLVVNDAFPVNGGFFLPLKLGAQNASLDSFTTPIFQLQNLAAYAPGGTVLATQATSLLVPEPLYLGASSGQVKQRITAINATCDGTTRQVLRFSAIGPLAIASAATNGTFAPGAGLLSPIVDNLLGVGPQVDLIVVPHNATTA